MGNQAGSLQALDDEMVTYTASIYTDYVYRLQPLCTDPIYILYAQPLCAASMIVQSLHATSIDCTTSMCSLCIHTVSICSLYVKPLYTCILYMQSSMIVQPLYAASMIVQPLYAASMIVQPL